MLLNDWNDVNFVIGTNPKDLIEIKFDVQSSDIAHGLNAYMNTLMNANEIINGFCLRKVTQYWPYQEGSHIYYMIAPPWKKLYIVSIIRSSKFILLTFLNFVTFRTMSSTLQNQHLTSNKPFRTIKSARAWTHF